MATSISYFLSCPNNIYIFLQNLVNFDKNFTPRGLLCNINTLAIEVFE